MQVLEGIYWGSKAVNSRILDPLCRLECYLSVKWLNDFELLLVALYEHSSIYPSIIFYLFYLYPSPSSLVVVHRSCVPNGFPFSLWSHYLIFSISNRFPRIEGLYLSPNLPLVEDVLPNLKSLAYGLLTKQCNDYFVQNAHQFSKLTELELDLKTNIGGLAFTILTVEKVLELFPQVSPFEIDIK